jgi:hypothetical protein
MSASDLEAPWIAAQRGRLLAQRGHAWLLQGPSGLGQYALGLSLVRAWLASSRLRKALAATAPAAMPSRCVPMPICACSCPRCR